MQSLYPRTNSCPFSRPIDPNADITINNYFSQLNLNPGPGDRSTVIIKMIKYHKNLYFDSVRTL